jgi:hypothetical protein
LKNANPPVLPVLLKNPTIWMICQKYWENWTEYEKNFSKSCRYNVFNKHFKILQAVRLLDGRLVLSIICYIGNAFYFKSALSQ